MGMSLMFWSQSRQILFELLEEDEEVDTVDPLLLCRVDCPSEVETVSFNRNYKRFINMDKRLRHHAKKVKQSVLKR